MEQRISITIGGATQDLPYFASGTLNRPIGPSDNFSGKIAEIDRKEFFTVFVDGSIIELSYHNGTHHERGLEGNQTAFPTGATVYFIEPHPFLMALVKNQISEDESPLLNSLKALL